MNSPAPETEPITPKAEGPRLFIAIVPSEEIREGLADISDRLQKAAQFTPLRATWVPVEHMHVTLYFLGNVSTAQADRLQGTLKRAADGCAPFALDYRKLGFFPEDSKEPPKVLWLGIHQPPQGLYALREACTDAIIKAGIGVPEGKFTPHLTLARLKSAKGLNPFRQMLRIYEFTKLGKSEVLEVTLMESITGGGPATYRPLASFPLGGGKA